MAGEATASLALLLTTGRCRLVPAVENLLQVARGLDAAHCAAHPAQARLARRRSSTSDRE